MDQVFIHNLLARGIIGITENERAQPQDILINITLFVDTRVAAESDSIDHCVNYRTVAKKILAHAEQVKRHTVEALAGDIARLCLEDQAVDHVRIRVEKPGAVRFSQSVGVEIERGRSG